MKPARILMGRIVGAHGIKGLVRVAFYGEDPQVLKTGGSLFPCESGGTPLSLRLLSTQAGGTSCLAEIQGIADRTQAESLKGTELWLDRASLPDLDSETFYHADLVGLEVHDEAGQICGKVLAVQDFGAGTLLEILPRTGASYYLPFTRDFVPDVALSEGYIRICPPEDSSEDAPAV